MMRSVGWRRALGFTMPAPLVTFRRLSMPQLRKVAKALETLDRTVHESGSPAPVGESARDLAGLRVALEQLVEENGRLRVEAEDLRQKEAHFRELFNATYDGIFLV